MKFQDKQAGIVGMVETVCLILSLGAIFLQIWILLSGLEAYFQGNPESLSGSLVLSGVAVFVCALAAWTTTIDFMKGLKEGRTVTYTGVTRFSKGKDQQNESN